MYTEVKHPLMLHKLSILRNTGTESSAFRELVRGITYMLAYEALKDVDTIPVDVQTPLETAHCRRIQSRLTVVPILRAGVGMLEAFLDLVPDAAVGFFGVYRDHDTAKPVEYYSKIPKPEAGSTAVIIDPMLATAGSSSAAVSALKRSGYDKIKILCIVSCPEGLGRMEQDHPDVQIYTAAVDRALNAHKYILPGLGDAGDRLFNTLD